MLRTLCASSSKRLNVSRISPANVIQRLQHRPLHFRTLATSTPQFKKLPEIAALEIPKPAFYLGFGGLIPFVATTAATVFGGPLAPIAIYSQILYGSTILCFLGGAQWGLASEGLSKQPRDPQRYKQETIRITLSVIPSFIAFASVALAGPFPHLALSALMTGLTGVYAVDVWSFRRGITPPWWSKLRGLLTFIVLLCLLTTSLAMVRDSTLQ
ncbi:hypothetical protein PROFUN_07328 [Planoprotostelium fungivorum]|uniref:Transmembrane protein 69 n=1 Tax=Planoprotostelium fungivorum TaxID=1890364 RepID=A0A2P6N417_9EUKA|nr:hypothetical protein PROFUN_13438 [Planoprotostelium fungivorum]PRP84943.1 hypothetical protein PROFUN_07328 [Planoprotostelium fungivorum]